MAFAALIVALVATPFLLPDGRLHEDGWFDRWREAVHALSLPTLVGSGLVIALPAIAAAWLIDAVRPLLFGVFSLLLGALALLFALGRSDWHRMVAQLRRCRAVGDLDDAWVLLGEHLDARSAGTTTKPEEDRSWGALGRLMVYEGFQRWFVPVMFFLLLGPAWAVAYRLLHLELARLPGRELHQLLFLADWVPARALFLSFALAGDFDGVRRELGRALDPGLGAGDLLWAGAGPAGVAGPADAADGLDAEALEGLLKRCAGGWLFLAAMAAIVI